MPKRKRSGRKSRPQGGSEKSDFMSPPTDGHLVTVPRSIQQTRRLKVHAVDVIASNMTPTLNFGSGPSISLNPSSGWLGGGAGICPQWTNISHSWDEYRILAVKLHFVPFNRYNKGGVSSGPMAIAYDTEGTITGYTLAQLLSYGTSVLCSLDDPWDVEWKIPTQASNPWFDTGLSISVQQGSFAIAAPATSLTASVAYGSLHVTLDVLLRGSRAA